MSIRIEKKLAETPMCPYELQFLVPYKVVEVSESNECKVDIGDIPADLEDVIAKQDQQDQSPADAMDGSGT